jgi:tetratricopeptide (TPR) repeat protein
MGLSLFEKMGVKRGIIYAKGIQAFVSLYLGEFDRANALANDILQSVIEINAPRTIAYSYEIYGLNAYARGDFEEARTFFQKALEVFQKIEDKRNIAHLWINFARTAYREDDRQGAMKYLHDSIALSRELGTHWTLSFGLEILGLLERDEGDYEQALNHFHESLKLSVEQSNQQGIANCLGALAGLAVLVNEPDRAACMFAASERIRRVMGAKMGSKDQQEYEHYLGILKNQLEVLELTTAWSEGSARTTEQILEDLEIWTVPSKQGVR